MKVEAIYSKASKQWNKKKVYINITNEASIKNNEIGDHAADGIRTKYKTKEEEKKRTARTLTMTKIKRYNIM